MDRTGQVWEAKGHMNGERIVIVTASRPGNNRFGETTVHSVLHVSGAKAGRMLDWTEQETKWDSMNEMKRLA